MSKLNKTESLSDKIAGILITTPASFDPEDDAHEDTIARVVLNDLEDDNEEVLTSQFRKQNIDYLGDVDKRYEGVTLSRKVLQDSDNESDEGSALSENGDKGSDASASENESDSSIGEELSGSEENSDDNESDINTEEGEVAENNFKHLRDSNLPRQIQKGVCVRHQLSTWENLLEMRIQIQKCLLAANKLPQNSVFNDVKAESGSEFTNKVSDSAKCVAKLLNSLLNLQSMLWNQYPETKGLLKNKTAEKTESDEVILSDTDDEQTNISRDDPVEMQHKKRKLADYENEICSRHKLFKNYSNSVIQKWYEKTKVTSTKNSTSFSILNQIDHVMSDRSKLIKRTQQKRSEYDIVGEKVARETKNDDGTVYNVEIFDDDDFYHQLLRELIEFKSANVTDPIQLGRQWIQLQNLRSKMKRKIDTKATKGRRLRYVVHSKLVNFMAPIVDEKWTDEAKSELFSSVFGKNQIVS